MDQYVKHLHLIMLTDTYNDDVLHKHFWHAHMRANDFSCTSYVKMTLFHEVN